MPATDDIAPPEQSVWTKYSPHHEFPLAGTASLLIHGIIIAGVFVVFIYMNMHWHAEENQPVKMDGAIVEGPGGGPDGGESGTGQTGRNSSPEEFVEPKAPTKTEFDFPPIALPTQPMPPKLIDDPVLPPIVTPPKTDVDKAFAPIEKKFQPDPRATPKPNPGGKTGGGVNGEKGGPGKGNVGPGPGSGPPGVGGPPGIGGTARAEVLARRWNFTPTGSSRDHVQKLIATGVRIGFVDGNNLFWIISDLKQRPVKFAVERFDKYADTVKWGNNDEDSVKELSRELQLPAPPRVFIMFLPKEKEQKFADAELQYAKSRNYDLQNVTKTWFDFQINRGTGTVTPVVRAQEPFDPRPY